MVEWLRNQSRLPRSSRPSPASALRATHTPLSGSVQPALATQRFAAVAAANGCTIIEGADVVALEKRGLAIQATTADTVFNAHHVLLAGGARAAPPAAALGVRLPVVPVKGVVCTSCTAPSPAHSGR